MTSPNRRATLRQVAAESLRNAADLAADGKILLAQDRLPRALALTILADEELAKAVLFVVGALGTPGALPELDRVLTTHRPKQALTAFTASVADLIAPALEEAFSTAGRVRRGELDTGTEDPAEFAVRHAIERLESESKKQAEAPPPTPSQLLGTTDVQELKNACLYADLADDGTVASPRSACPPRETVESYINSFDRRMTFVCCMIAGNVRTGAELLPTEESVISAAWNRMRRQFKL